PGVEAEDSLWYSRLLQGWTVALGVGAGWCASGSKVARLALLLLLALLAGGFILEAARTVRMDREARDLRRPAMQAIEAGGPMSGVVIVPPPPGRDRKANIWWAFERSLRPPFVHHTGPFESFPSVMTALVAADASSPHRLAVAWPESVTL